MEEILASIRRIIESGEERPPRRRTSERAGEPAQDSSAFGNSVAVPTPNAVVPQFDVHYLRTAYTGRGAQADGVTAVEDERTSATEPSAALEADHAPDEASVAHRPSEPAEKRMSLHEAWDELRPDAQVLDRTENTLLADGANEPDGGPSTLLVMPPAENENSLSAPDGDSERTELEAAPYDFAFEFDDEVFEAELRNEAWTSGSARSEKNRTAMPETAVFARIGPAIPAELHDSVMADASALLSAQAGEQVAAAFDDLTRAIREGQMRSMEDMAREMMRPMLQEWLDDNLPRIVERLVREEIERIARGPRR